MYFEYIHSHATFTALFKPLQAGTRILQQMCDHGKLAGSTTLLSLAPNLRKVLEALVYKVEILFASTDCADAFELGNLRHKDIFSFFYFIYLSFFDI